MEEEAEGERDNERGYETFLSAGKCFECVRLGTAGGGEEEEERGTERERGRGEEEGKERGTHSSPKE